MNHILMHKTTPVAEIQIEASTGTITGINKSHIPERLPLGLGTTAGLPDMRKLNKWWLSRAIPASRQNLNNALNELEIESTAILLSKSYGLSLSDQYWVNPVDKPLDWSQINFFENDFSDDMGNILTGAKRKKPDSDIDMMLPDAASAGWLLKQWKIINGKRCLIKGSSGTERQEPLNEVMATAVMKRLNINHTPYTLTWEGKKPYSVCENFVTSDTELVTGEQISVSYKRRNDMSYYQHFLYCCEGIGIENIATIQTEIDKMLTVDYIIVNQDRHYNNFGIIQNAVTLAFTHFAPIFDNGTSFWNGEPTIDISNQNCPCIFATKRYHENNIVLIKDFSWLDFSALNNIDEELSEILMQTPYVDDNRRGKICKSVKNRVIDLEKYASKR